MDTAATKLLESAAIKTLHSHNFSRSSTQATLVLTDLLSRYLALLSGTCSKYAHHSGRTSLTIQDAISVLEEMGVSMDELRGYCTAEARDLNRYASHSARRIEDLNEFKAQLSIGLKQDHDDAIPLEFQPYEPSPPSEYESEEEEDVEMGIHDTIQRPDATENDDEDNAMIIDTLKTRSPSPLERRPPPPRLSPPPLPLSPISNPSSPSRKRPRTSSWKPPSHIPNFLPPFPSISQEPPPSVPPSPRDSQLVETQLPLSMPQTEVKIDKPSLTVAQTMASSAASDYLVQVPYSQSSLSSVPEWHLPSAPPNSIRPQPKKNILPSLQTEPALFKAYHHVLTHRPPPTPPPSNLPRHKVAMAFLAQTQSTPRWDPADTLFSNVAPCPPRVAVIGPSYPIAINDPSSGKTDPKDKDFRFPPTIPRPVSTIERLTPFVGQQSHRIPELARHVLPPVIMNRTTRLAHPSVLTRGTKPVLYGPGIPAPWNSNTASPNETSTVPLTPLSSTSKDKERENGDLPIKPLLPDARLFATWDYEPKDPKVPLPSSHRHRNRTTSTQIGPSNVISLPLGASSRSRSGSKHG